MLRQALLTAVVTSSLLALAACGSDIKTAAIPAGEDGGVDLDAILDVSGDVVTEPDTADTSAADTAAGDTAAEDTSSDTADPCGGEDRPFGCGCVDDGDCASGYCTLTREGKQCTELCDDDCPDGFACRPVASAGSGVDPAYICVQRDVWLCSPCESNEDCVALGFEGEDECASYGDQGSFCATRCDNGSPCPSGYYCAPDGLCLSSVGTCECAPLHEEIEASTTCAVSNLDGRCEGTRACSTKGLIECNAPIPEAERCDGVDNDCDGIYDEDTCDDGDPCTTDTCLGTGGCSHTYNTAACDDGDACTDDDVCAEGTCAGTPRDCDDDNPCTTDQCLAGLGCVNLSNADDCDDGDACTLDDRCTAGACEGTPVDCDDDLACTADSCDPEVGCVNAADDALCDDGDPCTTDLCVPGQGCSHEATAAACDDGDPCTLGDTCGEDGCLGTPLDCSDLDGQCAVGVCEAGACVTQPLSCGVASAVFAFPGGSLDTFLGPAGTGFGGVGHGGPVGRAANSSGVWVDFGFVPAGQP